MGLARKVLKSLVQNAYTRFMDQVGSKLVVGIADTSSDAPNAFYQPKRDLYSRLSPEEGGKPVEISDR